MVYTHPHDEVDFNNGYFHLDKDITRWVAGSKFGGVIIIHVFYVGSDELTQEPTRKRGEFFNFNYF